MYWNDPANADNDKSDDTAGGKKKPNKHFHKNRCQNKIIEGNYQLRKLLVNPTKYYPAAKKKYFTQWWIGKTHLLAVI